jgi:hypothetical protein
MMIRQRPILTSFNGLMMQGIAGIASLSRPTSVNRTAQPTDLNSDLQPLAGLARCHLLQQHKDRSRGQ